MTRRDGQRTENVWQAYPDGGVWRVRYRAAAGRLGYVLPGEYATAQAAQSAHRQMIRKAAVARFEVVGADGRVSG